MRRILWTILALALATALIAPAPTVGQDPVLVGGEHRITIQKPGADDDASVRETIHYSVEEEPFSGTLNFTLDPQATLTGWFLIRNGTPFPGEMGQVQSDMPSSEQDGLQRFQLDLDARGVTFHPGSSYGIQLIYSLPADARSFQRQVDHPTPRLHVTVQSAPGLEPQSDDPRIDLRSAGNTWIYNTVPPEDPEPWVPGETLTVDLVAVDEAKTPLTVQVRTTGNDPLRLRAEAEGGIPPYTYSWDRDADGECETSGETVTIDRDEAGTHETTACVVDARGAEVRTTYETLTVEGPTVQAGPTAWLLALLGVVVGALLVYGLVSGGVLRTGGARKTTTAASGRSYSVEGKEMLELRQRVMVAGLKELEIAKKKGEVSDGLYTPLKAELKQDTVRVMRELERRREETV